MRRLTVLYGLFSESIILQVIFLIDHIGYKNVTSRQELTVLVLFYAKVKLYY